MAQGSLYFAQTPNPTIHRTSGKLCLPAPGDFQRWASPSSSVS